MSGPSHLVYAELMQRLMVFWEADQLADGRSIGYYISLHISFSASITQLNA